jgi:hypothetical protein
MNVKVSDKGLICFTAFVIGVLWVGKKMFVSDLINEFESVRAEIRSMGGVG